jgi:hypothetical protein
MGLSAALLVPRSQGLRPVIENVLELLGVCLPVIPGNRDVDRPVDMQTAAAVHDVRRPLQPGDAAKGIR